MPYTWRTTECIYQLIGHIPFHDSLCISFCIFVYKFMSWKEHFVDANKCDFEVFEATIVASQSTHTLSRCLFKIWVPSLRTNSTTKFITLRNGCSCFYFFWKVYRVEMSEAGVYDRIDIAVHRHEVRSLRYSDKCRVFGALAVVEITQTFAAKHTMKCSVVKCI